MKAHPTNTELDKVTINGITIDLGDSNPEACRYHSNDARDTNYIYIQSTEQLDKKMKATLKDHHVDVQNYYGNRVHLCRYPHSDLQPLRALSFVAHANCYHREFKTTKSVKDFLKYTSEAEVGVSIALHKGARDSQTIAAQIGSIAGVREALAPGQDQVIATVPARGCHWKDIESIDDVKAIRRQLQAVLLNDKARITLQLDDVITPTLATPRTTYNGAGQIITIADSGFDIGDENDKHPAFSHCNVTFQPVGKPHLDKKTAMTDYHGHGTHTAASAVGYGHSTATGISKLVAGTAYGADLIAQSIFVDGKINRDPQTSWDLIRDVFEPAFDAGSRVHSNSWGKDLQSFQTQLPYDADGDAAAIDQFVFENPDFCILVSAGNDNGRIGLNGVSSKSQIGGMPAAKNCITVGASQSSRSSNGYAVVPDGAEVDDLAPCYFSSRGPTAERRLKPDVVAPGNSVLSARSRQPHLLFQKDCRGVSYDPEWEYRSGTSMATPLVAGCVATIRQALLAQDAPPSPGYGKPSAALIKALLIHHARDMSGSRRIHHPQFGSYEMHFSKSPLPCYGYGRVNVDAVLKAIARKSKGGYPWSGYHDVQQSLDSHESRRLHIPRPKIGPGCANENDPENRTSNPKDDENDPLSLKATLVYLDPPGPKIENQLSLTVSFEQSGKEDIQQGWDDDDAWNNVQQHEWEPPSQDCTVTITIVAGSRVAISDQKFAVVWSWHRRSPWDDLESDTSMDSSDV